MKSKSKSKSKSTESKSPDFASSDFSSAITRIAVAQICQTTGFKAAQTSALETLTAITARYLETLGYAAASSASSTGRTESNLLDIIIALEDLHSVQGFIGSSNVNRSLFSSSVLNDVMRFVNYNVEIPFAKPIPRSDTGCPISVPNTIVPVVKQHDIRCGYYYSQQGYETPRGTCHLANLAHIPRWLPEIPDMGSGEEGSREEKWGFGEGGEGCLVGEKMGGEEKERVGNMELPVKRGKVRFKMGVGMGGERFEVDLRSGVCRGGKRVSCQIWSVNEDGKNVRSKR